MYVCVSHKMHPSMGACGWLSQFSSAKQNCSSTIPLSLRNAEIPIQPFATGTISLLNSTKLISCVTSGKSLYLSESISASTKRV